MSGGGNIDLGKDVGSRVVSRAPSVGDGTTFDKVTRDVVLDVDAFGLVRGYGVGGEGNATLVVFESLGRTGEGQRTMGRRWRMQE